MIKVTDEVREAARRLLKRHNEEEPHRVEAQFKERVLYVKSCFPGHTVNEPYIRKEAEREDPADRDKRKLLEAIVDGRRKLIDGRWWIEVHGTVDRAKLDAIARMADPARNDKEHERAVAARKLAAFKAKRPPGIPPPPPPFPETIMAWTRRRKKTKTSPSPRPSRSLSDIVKPDSVTASVESDATHASVAASAKPGVTAPETWKKRRAAKRAAKRASLKCQTCGKPLAAQRATARYCSVACRLRAWRRKSATSKRSRG
jgi:hypothetical protein